MKETAGRGLSERRIQPFDPGAHEIAVRARVPACRTAGTGTRSVTLCVVSKSLPSPRQAALGPRSGCRRDGDHFSGDYTILGRWAANGPAPVQCIARHLDAIADSGHPWTA